MATHVGTTRSASAGAAAAVPAGVVAGDLLLLLVIGTGAVPTSLTGYTFLAHNATSGAFAAFYRVATGSSDAPPAVTSDIQTLSAWRGVLSPPTVSGDFVTDTISTGGTTLDIPGASHALSAPLEIVIAGWLTTDAPSAVTGFTVVDSATAGSDRTVVWTRDTQPPSPSGTFSVNNTGASGSAVAWGQQFLLSTGASRRSRMVI